jgi:hypothetical protein
MMTTVMTTVMTTMMTTMMTTIDYYFIIFLFQIGIHFGKKPTRKIGQKRVFSLATDQTE